jgi:hypothetical protein
MATSALDPSRGLVCASSTHTAPISDDPEQIPAAQVRRVTSKPVPQQGSQSCPQGEHCDAMPPQPSEGSLQVPEEQHGWFRPPQLVSGTGAHRGHRGGESELHAAWDARTAHSGPAQKKRKRAADGRTRSEKIRSVASKTELGRGASLEVATR